MNKEGNFTRRVFSMCFWGIVVMLSSLCASGGRIDSANKYHHVPPPPISAASAAPGFDDRSEDGDWLFPAEYESHQAMWMLWPTFENKAGFPSTEPMIDMIRAMSGHVHVNLAVQDADEEATVRNLLIGRRVPLDHVHFFQIEHLDIWARDMGPQFTRNRSGKLRINDWNFNYWGNEDPESFNSNFEEHSTVPSPLSSRSQRSTRRPGPATGVRMIHEGGSVTHNGRGTMIAVESVVIQRNLGPNRFCGGQAPVTDYEQPNTYAPNPDWPACKALVENEYRRMLGVKNVIWVPTGVIEDNGTFRGALAQHIHIPRLNGLDIPHSGVYTMFTTNGHIDEFPRFVSPDTVVLAQETVSRTSSEDAGREVAPLASGAEPRTARAGLRHHLPVDDRVRRADPGCPHPDSCLDPRCVQGRRRDLRLLFSVRSLGRRFDVAGGHVGSLPASYVNYVPTNDLVIVSKFWKPGRSLETRRRDEEARAVLKELFPGREVAQVYTENVNRGGGGMNCITQQQPASAKFAQNCGWAKVQVGAQSAALYAEPTGDAALGSVPRVTTSGGDIYLKRLFSWGNRVWSWLSARPGSREGSVGLTSATSRAQEKSACWSIHRTEAACRGPLAAPIDGGDA